MINAPFRSTLLPSTLSCLTSCSDRAVTRPINSPDDDEASRKKFIRNKNDGFPSFPPTRDDGSEFANVCQLWDVRALLIILQKKVERTIMTATEQTDD